MTIVSQATRAIGSSARIASRIESEIWSAILSGWPSVTDSDVKVHWRVTGCSLCVETASRMARATARLSVRGISCAVPSAARITTAFVSCSKPTPGADTSLATMRSMPFRASLSAALARRSSVSAAKPTIVWPGAPLGAEGGEDVVGGLEDHLGHAAGLLDLGAGHVDGPEVGDGGGHHDHVGLVGPAEHGLLHLGGRVHAHDVDARRTPAATWW